jgi:hypothetical protein
MGVPVTSSKNVIPLRTATSRSVRCQFRCQEFAAGIGRAMDVLPFAR